LLLRKHIAFALALLILSGCAHDRSKTPSFHSEEESRSFHSRENELGRQIHQAILTSFRVYSEPRVVGYVTRMGNTLAKKASRKDLHYQFTVLYDDRLYATSAPGGFVYVTTGFINFCRNEAELSAVLERIFRTSPPFSVLIFRSVAVKTLRSSVSFKTFAAT